MKIDVINKAADKVSEFDFNVGYKPSNNAGLLINRVVRAMLANRRLGTVSTKTRGEVSGGGKKPWKQKGTGRARAGSIRSPLFRSGGVIFGPKPRDYDLKINKKEKRKAFLEALMFHIEAKTLMLFDDLSFDQPKTKLAYELISKIDSHKSLFILDKGMMNTYLALRNLKAVEIKSVDTVNTYDLMKYPKIITTTSIFEKLSRRFTNG